MHFVSLSGLVEKTFSSGTAAVPVDIGFLGNTGFSEQLRLLTRLIAVINLFFANAGVLKILSGGSE
jgi:hypothetical protein